MNNHGLTDGDFDKMCRLKRRIKMIATPIIKDHSAKEAIESMKKDLSERIDGKDRYLVTYHLIAKDKIMHYFDVHNFPTGDWGACINALAEKAVSEQIAVSAKSKSG
jgi:hypothetical protein